MFHFCHVESESVTCALGILFLLTNSFISFNDKAIILQGSIGTLFT